MISSLVASQRILCPVQINKLIRTSLRLVQELGRERTSEEIAKRMDFRVDEVHRAKKISQQPISLETPMGEETQSLDVRQRYSRIWVRPQGSR
jgi:DNA-directed RNA polymerase sigma subunit (sigma70/sigma32)